MGSEVSSEGDNGYQNGDIKKGEDLRENEADESEIDKDSRVLQDAGVKHHNGDLRSRKAGRGTGRTKADLKRAVLKAKSPGKKEQEKIPSPKWLSFIEGAASKVEKKVPRWLRRFLVLLAIVALGFGTRLFNLSLPSHIWLVQRFSSIVMLSSIESYCCSGLCLYVSMSGYAGEGGGVGRNDISKVYICHLVPHSTIKSTRRLSSEGLR